MILVQRPFIIISEMPFRQRFFLYHTFGAAQTDAASNDKEQILSLLGSKFNVALYGSCSLLLSYSTNSPNGAIPARARSEGEEQLLITEGPAIQMHQQLQQLGSSKLQSCQAESKGQLASPYQESSSPTQIHQSLLQLRSLGLRQLWNEDTSHGSYLIAIFCVFFSYLSIKHQLT